MNMRKLVINFFVLHYAIAISISAFAQQASPSQTVHIIYMGGNDCLPCVNWRRFELSKLEKTEEFKAVKFTYVEKTIKSAVPPTFFLPTDVRPFKQKLDAASGGYYGSPQTAIMVNGEVFDYFYGTRTAEEFVSMLNAIRMGSKYPFDRCIQRGSEPYSCEKKIVTH